VRGWCRYDVSDMALLDVRGLTVELPAAGWVRPVKEVSLRIAAGESLGLVGESGSGKTMLSLALHPGVTAPPHKQPKNKGPEISSGPLPDEVMNEAKIRSAMRTASRAGWSTSRRNSQTSRCRSTS
jgi:ABC-type dipeptide/oligopeptide/nickel transport system ATPase component